MTSSGCLKQLEEPQQLKGGNTTTLTTTLGLDTSTSQLQHGVNSNPSSASPIFPNLYSNKNNDGSWRLWK